PRIRPSATLANGEIAGIQQSAAPGLRAGQPPPRRLFRSVPLGHSLRAPPPLRPLAFDLLFDGLSHVATCFVRHASRHAGADARTATIHRLAVSPSIA